MLKEVFKSKKAICIVSIIVAFALLLTALYFAFFKKKSDPVDSIFYYPANYDENIHKNKAYQSLVRDFVFGSGGVETTYKISDEAQNEDPECRFFLDYFETVIEGNYNEYPAFFVDDYFEEKPKFTMQMIFEPYVSYHSLSHETIEGKETEVLNYYVRYKIFKNNGTFRKGIASGEAVPQIYQLIKLPDQSYRIFRILDIEFES